MITDVFAESSELLGSDVALLAMPDEDAVRLGLTPPIGFGAAYGVVDRSGDRKMARDFTRAVLTLRRDERVQGLELPLRIREVPVGLGTMSTSVAGSNPMAGDFAGHRCGPGRCRKPSSAPTRME